MSDELVQLLKDYAAIIDRMKPVVEAAMVWRHDPRSPSLPLIDAVDVYETGKPQESK